MNKSFSAVLIDTVSIQEYIFSSNKLKENIGASFLVKKIYERQLLGALTEIFPFVGAADLSKWREMPENIYILEKGNIPFEIGYIGGGNALLLFNCKEEAVRFIKAYTRLLLSEVPGLRTAFGFVGDFCFDNFKTDMKRLHDSLRDNKNRYYPNITLPKFGFNLECPYSNEGAEYSRRDLEGRFISSVSYVKNHAAEEALKEMESLLQLENNMAERYAFTSEVGKISLKKDEKGYVAVVHVDGNEIGEKFSNCKDLREMRRLSLDIDKIARDSFVKMLGELAEKMETDSDWKFESGENDRRILPVIPLVIGGDDLTFISDGRLGIWLAEVFVKNFCARGAHLNLSACAGISIVKTKYPFYKAYVAAEDLTLRSKIKARGKNSNASYLDFFISSAGWSGSIDDIYEKYMRTGEGSLHMGPYRLDSEEDADSIKKLKDLLKELNKLPRNKVMEIRKVLFEGREAGKILAEMLKRRNEAAAGLELSCSDLGFWENKNTLYFDAIELLDFYPEGWL